MIHVYINSIRYKSDSLIYMLDKNVEIFLISETKLEDSFPTAQFKKKVSPPRIGMIEMTKEVAFYCILGRKLHHVYCNLNNNAI